MVTEIEVMVKECTKCGKMKPLTEFHINKGVKSSKDGLRPSCKMCESLRNKQYRQTVKGNRINREKHFKARYGLTLNDRLTMYIMQSGCCACCGDSIALNKIFVDHDHETDEIRALLCWNCNVGLGHFKDDPIRLQKAIDYLGKHK